MKLKDYLEAIPKITCPANKEEPIYTENHLHTDGSTRDGTCLIPRIFSKTKELGRSAVAITDHGNLSRLYIALKERNKYERMAVEKVFNDNGIDPKPILKAMGSTDTLRVPTPQMHPFIEEYGELLLEALKDSIQLVVGVEAYICPDEEYRGYFHMVLYAVDEIGLKELYKMTNLAEMNQYKGRGRVTYANLERFVGEGTVGHGHIIATSACMQGPLSATLLKPHYVDESIKKLKAKLDELPPIDIDSIARFESLVEERSKSLKDKKDEKSLALKATKKSFTTKIDRAKKKVSTLEEKIAELEAQPATDKTIEKLKLLRQQLTEANSILQDLLVEEKENSALASMYDSLCTEVDELSVSVQMAKEQLKDIEKTTAPHKKILVRIEALEEEKSKIGDVYEEAKNLALYFDSIFGHDNFFIELQNHGIPQELYCLPLLKKISKETDIPMTVANDVHYVEKEDFRKRCATVAIRFGKNISDIEAEVGNDQLYFKTDEQMFKLFSDVPEALSNSVRIANRCNIDVRHDTWHLPTFDTGSDEKPNDYLRRIAMENLSKKFPNYDSQTDEYKEMFNKRLDYELEIIENMGFSSYIAIVADYIRYGRSIGGRPAVGPGRGSAAGSLVCYLVDITDVDPLRYNLLFERFLNPARVSMPDIDVDFAAFIREQVIAYVTELYSYKEEYSVPELKQTVCNIMTEGVFAARSAIRNIGRVTGVPLDYCDKVAKLIPNKPKMTIQKAFDENPDFKAIYESEPEAKSLIDDAMLIEGLPSHSGVHAAGVIIADKPITEYAPMFWNEKKQVWVIQYDMVSCEKDLKLLKMDFLGLTNLDIITDAVSFIKENHAVDVDFDIVNRADDPAVLENIYAKGLTNGVFQFESGGMKKTLVSFAPKSIDDVALLNAAYRPGPMQYIDSVTDVKFGREEKKYIVPAMAEILDETYGKPIYQEQIQKIFANIAGFDLGTADIIRRAMAKKHLDELVEHKDKFFNGLIDKGAKQHDVDVFWEELLEFANYAFNKSHAVAYSLVSYQTAWLKHYYPTEYMAALLKHTPINKLPFYIKEANDMGIRVLSPNINKSDKSFTPTKDGNIQFGLSSIKGVSNNAEAYIKERKERGEFASFKDLIIRMCVAGVNIRALGFLVLSGAFDNIITNKNRKVYSEILREYLDSCRNAYKKIANKTDVDPYAYLRANWSSPMIVQGPNFDKLTILQNEKDLVGFYISGHPLDDYRGIIDDNASMTIAEIDETTIASRNNTISIAGQIHDFLLLHRKSDGKAMCKFTFMDLTGDIECICFTKTFEDFNGLINENAIVKLVGYPEIETEEGDDGEVNVISQQFVVTGVYALSKPQKCIFFINNMIDYADILLPVLQDASVGNNKVFVNIADENAFYETDFAINLTSGIISEMNKNGIKCYIEKEEDKK